METLVAVGLLAMVLALGAFFSLGDYLSGGLNGDLNSAAGLLIKARAQSLANIGQAAHGVCYDSPNRRLVLFEGNDCSLGQNKIFVDLESSASVNWPKDIVFQPLSGDCQTCGNSGSLSFSLGGQNRQISVNGMGRIDY